MTQKPPPLRVAVIGCGAIAYEHLPFIASSEVAQAIALCDRSRALAIAAAERFGLEAALYVDADDMFSRERPDIVHVLTPPESHPRLVRQALAGGSHVVCEKPMTGSAEETAALLAAAHAAGKRLYESRNLLFNDPVIALLAAVRGGDLGEVRECDILLGLDFLAGPFGDTNLSGPAVVLPGGAVHDFLPHLVYLYQAIAGNAVADAVVGEYSNRSGNRRAVFNSCDVLLQSGRVRGRLRIACDVEPAAFRIAVRGTRGSAETDLYNPYLRIEGAPYTGKAYPLGQVRAGMALARAGAANLYRKISQHGTMHGMPRMLAAIYAAIREGAPEPMTPDEILATARLVDQIVALGDRK